MVGNPAWGWRRSVVLPTQKTREGDNPLPIIGFFSGRKPTERAERHAPAATPGRVRYLMNVDAAVPFVAQDATGKCERAGGEPLLDDGVCFFSHALTFIDNP